MEGGGDGESRFINIVAPAKIQGVLLHPAVTGCARLRCHGNTALRDCSRSFIQLCTEQRATHRKRAERGRRKKRTSNFKVTNQKHFSDGVVGEQSQMSLHLPSDTHRHAYRQTHRDRSVLSNMKEQTATITIEPKNPCQS